MTPVPANLVQKSDEVMVPLQRERGILSALAYKINDTFYPLYKLDVELRSAYSKNLQEPLW